MSRSRYSFKHLVLSAFGVTTLAAACAGGDYGGADGGDGVQLDEPIGTMDQSLCENKGGTNAVMTAIAVAAGRELRRWKPETDFRWNTSTKRLELTPAGLARCSGGKCSNTQAVLDMQKPEADGKVTFAGNIKLDIKQLAKKLEDAWKNQMSCNASGACNVPAHDLAFSNVEDGSCDKKYFFNPLKDGTSTWLSAASAATLSNKLEFVGYPSNKMLNFYVRDGQVSVDPTYGLNDGTTSTVGSCDAACTKYSTTDITGKCCSCNSATKKYARSAFNTAMYLCAG